MENKEKQCIDECMNQDTEKGQLKYLGYIVVATIITTAIALHFSPSFFESVDDKDGLYRYMFISVPKALMAMSVILTSVTVADFLVPGDLLKRITENAVAAAIFAGSLIMGVAIAM